MTDTPPSREMVLLSALMTGGLGVWLMLPHVDPSTPRALGEERIWLGLMAVVAGGVGIHGLARSSWRLMRYSNLWAAFVWCYIATVFGTYNIDTLITGVSVLMTAGAAWSYLRIAKWRPPPPPFDLDVWRSQRKDDEVPDPYYGKTRRLDK